MITATLPSLTLENVRFGYRDRPDFLGSISMEVRAGESWALVGPNGAGKSTLLRLMAGLLQPQSGRILLAGRSLDEVSANMRARQIAFLPQATPSELALPAGDIVLMGRFPYRSWSMFESADDLCEAERAMALTQTLHLAGRPLATLSGGEAQRVHLAAALAQRPQILLLDEPTASLDVKHQLAIFSLLRDLTRSSELAVVAVTHDVNLAARFCSHVMVLDGKGTARSGETGTVLIPEVLQPVYGVKMATASLPGRDDRRWIVPLEESNGERA